MAEQSDDEIVLILGRIVLERFRQQYADRVIPSEEGCWDWKNARPDTGYAMLQFNMTAHRFSYLEANGELTPGLTIEHTCGTRPCTDPAHLKEMTQGENNRAIGERTGKCRKLLHEMTPENTLIKLSRGIEAKVCRACRRETNMKNYYKNHEARKAKSRARYLAKKENSGG
jgi:hypothetical protein